MTAKKAAGHAHKHVSSSKHHGTSKHSPSGSKKSPAGHKTAKVTTKGKHPAHAKARGFAVGDLLPVCSLEAVAMSARLAGYDVADDDVAGLWDLIGCPEEGVAVGEALRIAARQGIGGVAPGRLDCVRLGAAAERGRRVAELTSPVREFFAGSLGPLDERRPQLGVIAVHGLILGVDVPGPHAVLATPDGWWSWGELHDPWPCTVEEAWAVSW